MRSGSSGGDRLVAATNCEDRSLRLAAFGLADRLIVIGRIKLSAME
jgi:hypothetical protein